MAKNRSDGVALGCFWRKPAMTRSISFSGTQAASFLRRVGSSSSNVVGSPAPISAVVSVRVVPIIIGTFADTGGASGSHMPFGSVCPSTTGL